MNVKPGDLGIVIKGDSAGRICVVVSLWGYSEGESYWRVEHRDPVPTRSGAMMKAPLCPDSWLRPVSGLPDTEHTDEREPIKELT